MIPNMFMHATNNLFGIELIKGSQIFCGGEVTFYFLEDFVASTRCWHSVLDSTVKRQEYFRERG